MQVRQLMTSDPTSCHVDTPLTEVARMMIEHDCGAIPVVADTDPASRLVGMVTDRDIAIRAVAAGKAPASTTAGEIMSHPVVFLNDTATVEECLHVMQENRVRRAPIVDWKGSLVGIVAQADLATRSVDDHAKELIREVSQGFGPGSG